MKFKITSRQGNNQVVHYYDNITQDIETEDHIPVYLDQDPRCKGMTEFQMFKPHDRVEYKSNEVRHLRIQLGLNCNYHCTYCNQAPDRDRVKSVVHLPNEVRVRNFIKMLKDNDIKCTKRITLWGGEPFVYWKLMKILVPELKKLYPDVMFSTISNGSLLDEEKTQWLIDNDFVFTISHDAQGFSAYRSDKNPLDDPKIVACIHKLMDVSDKRLKEINRTTFAFNVVITTANCDLMNIDKYFTEKFGRSVTWHFESVAKLDKWSKDKVKAFEGDFTRTLLNHMLITGTSDPQGPFWSIRNDVSRYLNMLINRVDANSLPYSCDVVQKDVLACTLEGEVINCHGSDPRTATCGHLNDLAHTTLASKTVTWMDRPKCKDCPVLINCRSGCCIVDDEDNSIMCNNLRIWHTGLLACCWKILFNSIIEKIEPVSE